MQLAMRSGLYATLNSGAVCEGQIREIDFITGEIVRGEKISDKVVGYVAYMELLNGFRKSLYMTVEEIQAHAEKHSQSFAFDLKNGKKSSVWSTNFDAMAKKTVLKKLLSSFGIISIDQKGADLATALQADQAVITEGGLRYIDNEPTAKRKLYRLMKLLVLKILKKLKTKTATPTLRRLTNTNAPFLTFVFPNKRRATALLALI